MLRQFNFVINLGDKITTTNVSGGVMQKYVDKFTKFFLITFLTLAKGWTVTGPNSPDIFDKNFEWKFFALPLAGKLAVESSGWPSYFWPNIKGGIAHRWNAATPMDFQYQSPSLEELRKMDGREIGQLSPAEKFDIYLGQYDYPTVRSVWRRTPRNSSDWSGICHGMAPASLYHPEPKMQILTNGDGLRIPFFSSDIKAILGNHYAYDNKKVTKQIGKRCFFRESTPILSRRSACQDVNAATFHIVLGNMLGKRGKGFFADLERYNEVWNHLVLSYHSNILEDRSYERFRILKIETSVTYTGTIDPSYTPVLGTSLESFKIRSYLYTLKLNNEGKIISGQWNSKVRPDFLWLQENDGFYFP